MYKALDRLPCSSLVSHRRGSKVHCLSAVSVFYPGNTVAPTASQKYMNLSVLTHPSEHSTNQTRDSDASLEDHSGKMSP